MATSYASDSAELTWQGAAGRTPQSYLIMRIDTVAKDSGGLFGIRNSPSLAGAFPNPTVIEASGPSGRRRLRGPAVGLPSGLVRGDRVVIGIVDTEHFLCVLIPPPTLADEAVVDWATTQPCG